MFVELIDAWPVRKSPQHFFGDRASGWEISAGNDDDVSSYEHEPVAHPLTGAPAIALKRQRNGDCFYLGPTGCTIHDRAPALCREFDC
jgi:Fe-S-cluster containining protein